MNLTNAVSMFRSTIAYGIYVPRIPKIKCIGLKCCNRTNRSAALASIPLHWEDTAARFHCNRTRWWWILVSVSVDCVRKLLKWKHSEIYCRDNWTHFNGMSFVYSSLCVWKYPVITTMPTIFSYFDALEHKNGTICNAVDGLDQIDLKVFSHISDLNDDEYSDLWFVLAGRIHHISSHITRHFDHIESLYGNHKPKRRLLEQENRVGNRASKEIGGSLQVSEKLF